MSETSKYRHLTEPHCHRDDGRPGCGVDIASGGDPVVPWAWQLELLHDQYQWYNAGHGERGPIQLRGDAKRACSEPDCLDFVYASHILEDFLDWEPVLKEWVAMLKPGTGKLIVLIPDKKLWGLAIAKGQPPNCQHQHEGEVGELSTYAQKLGLEVICDQLTNCHEGDYSILFVARRK